MKNKAYQWLDQNATQRKTWYSSVAKAYDYARPRYLSQLIEWAVELAQLSPESTILEVGCGPGIATVAFAELGFSMLGLEPSFQMCELARQNCQSYSNVEIQQTLFEEWQREEKTFNAFLAANSFHWIPAEDRYIKASEALQDQGFLILFWNLSMQPTYEVYQTLNEVYELYAPSLMLYESQNRQKEILQELGQDVIESGYFKDLVSKHIPCEKTYNIDDYLILLSTFSPYIGLDSSARDALFDGIREKIEKDYDGKISLSYLSAVQVAQKI
ncbi:bifunctional 2-polyprenyl-6-hydroxyphenol methylase/3-demethylubiquinol 3-O-methyltransferase UbiG [Chroococcus sp. FPU101]|uniref:class I SAM-dependent methyltransferase n=1 Tax=Chroococcus sp. FPU101 TaxID=1974212 RepID=UPI001A8F43B4|nr:class I SAM-dependent methyltransferase [Chroococcus sp. FPU101]GFE68800.1 hypothetical protein CFPU101_14100 [Chroococcus sp. FPU101]